jgi:glutamate synthase (NADPH/NADH)
MKMLLLHFDREQQGVTLPEVGRYATGIFFMDKSRHEESEGLFAVLARECDLKVRQ